MGTNVGNLNATLSLSAFEFSRGLKQSETAAIEFATTTEVQSQRASAALNNIGRGSSGSIAGKTAGVVQQVGFAMQDFSSQIGTRGIGPAIGAVTNNVQMLGMAFGPIPAAIAAVGGALAGILLPRLIETGSLFGKTKEEMNAFEKQVHDLSEKTFKPWRELENEKFDVLKGTEKQLDERIARMDHKMELLSKESFAEKASADNAQAKGLTDEVAVRNKRIEEIRTEVKEKWKARQSINALRPTLQQNEAFDENAKIQKEAAKAEADVKKKSLQEYGTAAQQLESKLAAERNKLAELQVNKETMDRFEAMANVERKKVEITEAQKKLSEMGTPAGMSAGAQRDSAAGVSAINRAVAGTNSDQSMAKRAIKLQEEQLKELQTIARDGKKPPAKVFALSG